MIVETEIKRLRAEIKYEFFEMRKLIMGRNIIGNWVTPDVACATLNIKPRQLRNLRIHIEKGQRVGSIRWRKGNGRLVQYDKRDLEAYLNKFTVA